MITEVDFSGLHKALDALDLGLDSSRVAALCEANLACYIANMAAIAEREGGDDRVDRGLIADCEGRARTVGEKRVALKGELNRMMEKAYPKTGPPEQRDLDIALSIGEMIDRLSIEKVKLAHFDACGDSEKRSLSVVVYRAVKECLIKRAEVIKQTGSYCACGEVRTYGI